MKNRRTTSARSNKIGFGRYRLQGVTGKVLASCFILLLCLGSVAHSEITIVSHHLRDRAIVTDSLQMRRFMIFSFSSSLPLARLKNSMVASALSVEGSTFARDTTYIFDEPAGNIIFGLPFDIPDGVYGLTLKILSPKEEVLDSYTGEFDRTQFGPYYKREMYYWDNDLPYANLQCRGYGDLTYKFTSSLAPGSLQGVKITARMSTDNEYPAEVAVFLNGVALGEFELPGAGARPEVVSWLVKDRSSPGEVLLLKGENRLRFSLQKKTGPAGQGIRIYSAKIDTDPGLGEGVPLVLTLWGADEQAPEIALRIPVWGNDGENIDCDFHLPVPAGFTEELPTKQQVPLALKEDDARRGYVVFSRSYLSHVYPWTIPTQSERTDSLGLRLARNDFEPITFSIYPVRDLGRVQVEIDDLRSADGNVIAAGNVQLHVARLINIRSGGNRYRKLPRLLERSSNAYVPSGYSTRFWLTFHADSAVVPGLYHSSIRIEPEKEQPLEIPLVVEVLPVELEPVPELSYAMLMSYEFFEMDSKDLSAGEKEKVYREGLNILKDYKNHGLNTLVFHSPFAFQWNRDGTAPMEHFKATVRGAAEVGFTNPLVWYNATYLQSAKSQHPGNVRLYEREIHTERAKLLARTAIKITRELGGSPPVDFMPIDEPRIASRQKIALELFRAIKQVPGARVVTTTDIGGKLLDVGIIYREQGMKLLPGQRERKSVRPVWEYDNMALMSLNPGYSRYIYGYYTWRQDLDGMSAWGPNTAENSRANPYKDLDHDIRDWMLFYPHQGGPLPSYNWEAIREGIDDVRYLYQLEKLIRQKASSHPGQTRMAGEFLDEIRSRCDFDELKMTVRFLEWTPEAFDNTRAGVISWILKLKNL